MKQGYVAVHRKMLDNPIVCKDTEYMAVWMYLLLNATHTNYDVFFKGERITLLPGQLLTGRQSIAKQLKVSESKVQRILKLFEIEQQIEQQTSNQNRLITILQWSSYQYNGQQTEQQVNNNRTTDEQQVNTNNNVNKVKNENNVEYSNFVDRLLPLYPGRKSKSIRDKRLPKILKEHGEDEIIECVKNYARLVKGTDKQYILNESTFWNTRYIDFIRSNYKDIKKVKIDKSSDNPFLNRS